MTAAGSMVALVVLVLIAVTSVALDLASAVVDWSRRKAPTP